MALVQFKLSFHETKLKERLIEEDVLSAEAFDAHWQTYQQDYLKTLSAVSGRSFEVNAQGILEVRTFPDGELLADIPLLPEDVEPPAANTGAKPFAPSLLFLHAKTGKYITNKSLKFAGSPTFFITDEGTALAAFKGFEKEMHLAQTDCVIDTPSEKSPDRFHYDFFVTPDREHLLVFHREEGALLVISLSTYEFLEEFIVVKDGSDKALNVAFDKTGKAYITDNVSRNMHFLEFSDQQVHFNTWTSGMGTLGNLSVAQEPGFLYITIIKPYSLYYFDLSTMKPKYSVNIQGTPHSQMGGATDFMLTNQNRSQLYVLNAASAKSSYIHSVDLKEVQLLQSDASERVTLPHMVALAVPSPIKRQSLPSLEQWLVEKGIITAEQLAEFKKPKTKKAVPKPALGGGVRTQNKVKPPADFVAHTPPPPSEDIMEMIGKKAPPKELPPEADEVIVNMIVYNFYQATLTNLEVHSTELFKLRKLAAQARKDLTNQMTVLISIPSILGKYTFETPISRDQVLHQLQFHKSGKDKYHLSLCPECSYPMEPIKDCMACPVCEYAFDTPEEMAHREKVSLDGVTFGQPGQLLLPLTQANKVVFMNAWHQVLRVFEGKTAWIRDLADAMILPNQNLLVTDIKGSKVAEYDSSGKLVWKAKAMLKNPIKTSVYEHQDEERFLIVEFGGSRVIELDRKGKQHRKYPGLKTPLNYRLKEPVDVQRTPENHWLIADQGLNMVLEVDEKGKVVRTWGEDEGISQPMMAKRLPEGQTLIVEASNCQVKLFNAMQEELHSFAYWPPEDDRWKEKAPPNKVVRLHQGDLVFMGEDYYYQFNAQLGTYRWLKTLPANLKSSELLYRVKVAAKERSIDRQKKVEDYKAFLKTIPFLKDVPDKKLQSLAQEVRLMSHKAKEVLQKDLGQGGSMYFIKSGTIQVIKMDTPMLTLGPGEVFGVIPLVLGASQLQATVVAETDCELFHLDRASYQKVVIRFSQFFGLLREIALERQFKVKRFLDEKTQKVTDELNYKIMRKKVQEHPMFSEGSPAFYDDLANQMRPMAFLPDQDIFSRGESGGTLYFINTGQVGVLRKGERHAQVMLEDGDVFGEMSLMRDAPRNATLRTLDYSRIYELDRNHAQALINKHPWLKEKLEEITLQREESNQIAALEFEEKMGLARPDLPEVKVWSPLDIRENELVYFPTVLMDRVVGVDNSGDLLWCAGKEPVYQFDKPYRIQLRRDSLLIADSGNDRIVEIDLDSRKPLKEWKGKDFGFETPRSASMTQKGELLVADEFNSRIVKINEQGQIVWEYGPPNEIKAPLFAEETFEGTLLFADAELHKVYELDELGDIIWQYGQKGQASMHPGHLNAPAFAHRLKTGETLIADTGNDRIVIVDNAGDETAVFYGTEEFPLLQPKHCVVRENGDMLVFSGAHELVVRIDRWGEPIWGVVLEPPPKDLEEKYIQSAQEKWDDVFVDPFEKEMLEMSEAPPSEAPVAEPASKADKWDDIFEDPFEKEMLELTQVTPSPSAKDPMMTQPLSPDEQSKWDTIFGNDTEEPPQPESDDAAWGDILGESSSSESPQPESDDAAWGDILGESSSSESPQPETSEAAWDEIFDNTNAGEDEASVEVISDNPELANRVTRPLSKAEQASWERFMDENIENASQEGRQTLELETHNPELVGRVTKPLTPAEQEEWERLFDTALEKKPAGRKTQPYSPEEQEEWVSKFEEVYDAEQRRKPTSEHKASPMQTQVFTQEEEAHWAEIFGEDSDSLTPAPQDSSPTPTWDVPSPQTTEASSDDDEDLGSLEDNWDDIFGD